MDTGRLALFKPLGLLEWQLRRPELMALQGQLPVATANDSSAESWTLWLLGDKPRWLDDVCCLFRVPPQACQPWDPAIPVAALDAVLVLTPPVSAEVLSGVPAAQLLDGRGGKRQLWQQLCASGRLAEVVDA
jgi:DNA polymerase III psi subunit